MEEKIILGGLELASSHGIKFTMDELATTLAMSKKTIYTIFKDKESLLLAMVDYVFDQIKETEAQVMATPDLSSIEKLRLVLAAMPESMVGLDFGQVSLLQLKYPLAYIRMNERLEGEWESTLELLDAAVKEKAAIDVDFRLFQLIYTSALERFLSGDELKKIDITYVDALQTLVNIMVDGIAVR